MCAECVAAVMTVFPEISDDEVGDFLMNCTAFPFSSPEFLLKQLRALREKTSDYKECYAIVEEEMEKLSNLSDEEL